MTHRRLDGDCHRSADPSHLFYLEPHSLGNKKKNKKTHKGLVKARRRLRYQSTQNCAPSRWTVLRIPQQGLEPKEQKHLKVKSISNLWLREQTQLWSQPLLLLQFNIQPMGAFFLTEISLTMIKSTNKDWVVLLGSQVVARSK